MSDKGYSCPKCGQSGTDWSLCEKRCPDLESPWFDAKVSVAMGSPKRPNVNKWKMPSLRDHS